MKKTMFVLTLVSLFVLTGTGMAQIVEKSSDLSIYAGILKFDGGDSELMFGGRYNYNVNVNSSIEGTVGLIFPDNAKIYLYHVNYRYNLSLNNELLVPFVTGGVGAVTTSPDVGDGDTNLSINFGGGMQYFTKENLAIRFDFRDILIMQGDREIAGQTIEGETTSNLEFTGGITYYFI